MTWQTVHEYAVALRARYWAAKKGVKKKILDEFCETTGMHRKAANRLLAKPRPRLAVVAYRSRELPKKLAAMTLPPRTSPPPMLVQRGSGPEKGRYSAHWWCGALNSDTVALALSSQDFTADGDRKGERHVRK